MLAGRAVGSTFEPPFTVASAQVCICGAVGAVGLTPLRGLALVSSFPKFGFSEKNLAGGLRGDIGRVAGVLLGLFVVMVFDATVFATGPPGLNALAVGLGLNSIAWTLNLVDVAEGGPRPPGVFCGLGMPLLKFDPPLIEPPA